MGVFINPARGMGVGLGPSMRAIKFWWASARALQHAVGSLPGAGANGRVAPEEGG